MMEDGGGSTELDEDNVRRIDDDGGRLNHIDLMKNIAPTAAFRHIGFTLQIHHGGKLDFPITQYVGGEISQFGYIDVQKFCQKTLHYFVTKKCGYAYVESIYYKIPGKELKWGLRLILTEDDIKEMMKHVKDGDVIEVYVEGGVKQSNIQEERFLHYEDERVNEVEQRNENGAESSEDDEEYIASEEDVEYEQDEYEEENADVASLTHLSEDESDELWNLRESNIQKKKAKGKKNTQQQADRHNEPTPPLTEEPSLPLTIVEDLPDYDTEYDSCYYDSPVEDEENPGELISLKEKYEVYNPKMDMFKFEPSLGMLFASNTEVKNAFRDYSVVTGRSLRFAKNNRQMVIVKCKPGCPYRMYAAPIRKEATYQIRTLTSEHKCNKNFKVPMANASAN
ncbi:hypothetical protein FRX31_019728 [Thalictrum thalictroides]|uniref:Transposase MuDR plant domain-containing protein n=1 Tax=Thalictrum thalictroides TaxID=46969 RepID=A0A7J6W2Z8_THATH|nr:hypothetical protein FRX31_019728 [Thalictrum thalictroides]